MVDAFQDPVHHLQNQHLYMIDLSYVENELFVYMIDLSCVENDLFVYMTDLSCHHFIYFSSREFWCFDPALPKRSTKASFI